MIKEYIYARRKLWIVLAVFLMIHVLVFRAYQLLLEPVLYTAVLCVITGSVITIFDFMAFQKKHRTLERMKKQVCISLDGFPDRLNRIEEDYYQLVEMIFNAKKQAGQDYHRQYDEMLDYYTMWAHQIKTPIAAMRLLLQSEEHPLGEEMKEQLFKIEQYVEMVLQYLRSESMSSDLTLRECSLDDIIKAGVRKYARSFIRKKISLNYDETGCQVLTDPKWLIFVVEQLLSNALKYTDSGSISIYMDKRRTKALVIEDTGIGIQQEDLPRVFEKGFTGYNGRENKKSTGIGLYLCKRILTKLSHTIEVFSDTEHGTRVIIGLASADRQYD